MEQPQLRYDVLEWCITRNNLSQGDFARKVGTSPAYLSLVLSRKKNVGPRLRRKLLDAVADFGLGFDDLFVVDATVSGGEIMAKKKPPTKPELVAMRQQERQDNIEPLKVFTLPKMADDMLDQLCDHLGGIERSAALAVAVALAYNDLVGGDD